jgi:E3 ubiquitin-protein ligase SHPRH
MAEKEVNRLTEELQNAIKEHNAKGEALKGQSPDSIPGENQNQEDEAIPEGGNGGKGKEREHSPISNDQDNTRSVLGEEHAAKRRALQQRLREMRLVLHRVKFLQGDVYHVLGSQHSALETEAYGIADEIRRELLKGTLICTLYKFLRLISFPKAPKRTPTA